MSTRAGGHQQVVRQQQGVVGARPGGAGAGSGAGGGLVGSAPTGQPRLGQGQAPKRRRQQGSSAFEGPLPENATAFINEYQGRWRGLQACMLGSYVSVGQMGMCVCKGEVGGGGGAVGLGRGWGRGRGWGSRQGCE